MTYTVWDLATLSRYPEEELNLKITKRKVQVLLAIRDSKIGVMLSGALVFRMVSALIQKDRALIA